MRLDPLDEALLVANLRFHRLMANWVWPVILIFGVLMMASRWSGEADYEWWHRVLDVLVMFFGVKWWIGTIKDVKRLREELAEAHR